MDFKTIGSVAFGFAKEVGYRAVHLGSLTKSVTTMVGNLSLTVLSTAADILHGGTEKSFARSARYAQAGIGASFAKVGEQIIKTINPYAQFEYEDQKSSLLDKGFSKGRLKLGDIPFNFHTMALWQQKKLSELGSSPNFFEKEIASRLFSGLSSSIFALGGAASTGFGLLTTLMAIITAGYFPKVNSVAYNNLRSVGFTLNQIHQGLVGVVNPGHLCGNPVPNSSVQYFNTG